MRTLTDCCAFVTGANRGLGRAFCEGLLTAGAAKVYAGSRDPARVLSTDSRIVPVRLDVTRFGDVDAAAVLCNDVTLLINNAGVLENAAVCADGAEQAARHEMETNYFGTLSMVRAFAPVLARNGGGTIVNILSVASWFGSPFMATYCASKAAAAALTDSLRVELHAEGTHVVGVYAGYLDTDMAAHVSSSKTDPRQVVERTFDAVSRGLDRAFADDRTYEVDQRIRTDRDAFYADLQRRWGRAESFRSPLKSVRAKDFINMA